jgi:hypothetical protein
MEMRSLHQDSILTAIPGNIMVLGLVSLMRMDQHRLRVFLLHREHSPIAIHYRQERHCSSRVRQRAEQKRLCELWSNETHDSQPARPLDRQ